MPKVYYNVILLVLLSFNGFSQYFVSPANSGAIQWKQINTEQFQIIFPTGFEQDANKTANYLSYIFDKTNSLNHTPKKLTIILQNQGVQSNGFVVWAPKRSEFYTTPSPDFDTNDWLAVLSLHEFRHVVQISKLNQGITKLANIILGQQATFLTTALIPVWFYEGDAVFTETNLTQGGRGRRPNFGMPLRAQILEKGAYSYEKASFGSYKDIVDNHYKLGYHIVSYVNNTFGNQAWDQTINYVAKKPFVPFSFSHGLKKATGFHSKKIYAEMSQNIDSLWEQQLAETAISTKNRINTRKTNIPTSYKFPNKLNDTTYLTVKTGFNLIPTLVSINRKGRETKLHEFGSYNLHQLSAQNNKVVWVENIPDKRWEQKVYSDIKLYDYITKTETRITRKRRLFSPSLNNQADKIVAVNVSVNNIFKLEVLDINGNTLTSLKNPENYFYSFPTWINDSLIGTIIQKNNKKSLVTLNVNSGLQATIIPFSSSSNLSNPYYKDGFIYFEGEYSGILNIFAVNIKTREVFQVSSVKYGGFNPTISNSGKELLFENYTATGYDACQIIIDTTKWIPLAKVKNKSINYFEFNKRNKQKINIFDSVADSQYVFTKYNKVKNLFNFHSWLPSTNSNSPYLSSLDDYSMRLGFTLLSQNNLSDLVTVFSYEHYNTNLFGGTASLKKRNAYNLSLSYTAFYPVISLKTAYYNDFYQQDSASLGAEFFKITPTISLPLNYSTNKFNRFANLVISQNIIGLKTDTSFNWQGAAKYSISVSNILKQAKTHLLPKSGQKWSCGYSNSPFNSSGKRNAFYGFGSLYLPGFKINDGIYARAGGVVYGANNTNYNPLENSKTSEPRGLVSVNKQAVWFYKLEYHTPLLYPDLNISFLSYIKRISASVFYDHTYYKKSAAESNSYGIEIIGDMNLLRFSQEVQIGFRLSGSNFSTGAFLEPIIRLNLQ